MVHIGSLINTLVMDYLVSEGYPSAAQNFALEANIQPRADVESIQERVEIRNAIYGGDIQTAIEKINELNPQVGSDNGHTSTQAGSRPHILFAMIRLRFMHHSYTPRVLMRNNTTSVLSMSTTSISALTVSLSDLLRLTGLSRSLIETLHFTLLFSDYN